MSRTGPEFELDAGGSDEPTPTDTFLRGLAAGGPQPLLAHASGTLRFDLDRAGQVEHRYLTLGDGAVTVAPADADADTGADAVIRGAATTFDGMATGTVNAMAAVLRGELIVEGDLSLVFLLQRLFPSPPGGDAPATPTAPTAPGSAA
jgi:hypothetical protein